MPIPVSSTYILTVFSKISEKIVIDPCSVNFSAFTNKFSKTYLIL